MSTPKEIADRYRSSLIPGGQKRLVLELARDIEDALLEERRKERDACAQFAEDQQASSDEGANGTEIAAGIRRGDHR